VLEVCERHGSEYPNKCEGLVYEARGDEAHAIAHNEKCTQCGRPLARILDRITGVTTGACDYCFRIKHRVAVARAAFLAVPLKICLECASDASIALQLDAGREDFEDDDE
jgi:ferredoxin